MPKILNTHIEITVKMLAIGYDINEEGVCAGASMAAIEAAINNNLDTYIDTINYIQSRQFKPRTHRKNARLFPDIKNDIENINAHAILDQIQIYHVPEYYYELFQESVSQNESEKTASLVQSNKSIIEGGLITQQDWSWSGSYKQSRLKTMLDEIKNSTSDNQLIAMRLGNINHHIALTYKNDKWTLIDINSMPPQVFTSIRKLALALSDTLYDDNPDQITFSFTVFSSGINRDMTQHFIDKLKSGDAFKKIHHISKRHIDDRDAIKLAQLAVCNHQKNLLDKLIERGLNVNTPTLTGFSLVYLAAQFGYTDMINSLVKAGADYTRKEGEDNLTPLQIAMTFHHTEAEKYLREQETNRFTKTSP